MQFQFHSLVPNCKNNSHKNEQHCSSLFGKKRNKLLNQQGNLVIFNGKGDHNYCRVSPKSPQQGDQHAVTNPEQFK